MPDIRVPALAGLLVTLTACASSPAPEAQDVSYPAFLTIEGQSSAEPLDEWWTAFEDETLTELIADARAANRDLAVAANRLRAAEARLGLARQNRLPTDTLSASAVETKSSAGFAPDAVANDGLTVFSTTAQVGWEVDLFGRIGALIDGARADRQALKAALSDTTVLVLTDTADAYVALRGLQKQKAVAEQNAENQARTLELVQNLRAAGRVTDLDLAQARSQLAATRATIPPLDAAIAAQAFRLGTLTGKTPAEIMPLIERPAPLPIAGGPLAVGDPSALLARRPDLRAAAARVEAASAGTDLQVASLFPRIDLLGSIGARAPEGEELFTEARSNYSVGPQIQWSITDLLRARSRIAAARADTDAALAAFEGAVLSALAETETGLVDLARTREQQGALVVAEEASERAASLARLRYEAGAADFLTVLDAERRLLEATTRRAAAETALARAQVRLFRVLRAGAPAPLP